MLNVADKDGSTPLIRAFDEGVIESAKLLIANGADVTVKKADGSTLLHNIEILGNLDAMNTIIGSLGVLERGLRQSKGRRGNTALGYVINAGASGRDFRTDVVGALLSAGADPNVFHEIDFGRSVSRASILAMACYDRNLRFVTQLLDARADVNVVSEKGTCSWVRRS